MRPPSEERHRRAVTPSVLNVVLRAAAAVALPVFGGYALDRALGTSPWLLLTGALAGTALVMIDLFRQARR